MAVAREGLCEMEEQLLVEEDVLEERLEMIDGSLRLEPAVEKALQLMALDFAEEVVTGTAQLAKHRGAAQVSSFFSFFGSGGLGSSHERAQISVNDMASHLLTQWGIRIPAFRSETRDRLEEATRNATEPSVHRARLDIKATLQEAALEEEK